MLLAALVAASEVAHADVPQLQMDQPLHAVDVWHFAPGQRGRRRRRRRVGVVADEGQVVRALARPLVQTPLDVARAPDLQADRAGAVARWLGCQGVEVAGRLEGVANPSAACCAGRWEQG